MRCGTGRLEPAISRQPSASHDDMLAADLAPAVDRHVAQDDRIAVGEVDRRDGVGQAAAHRLDRDDLGRPAAS